VEITSLSFAGFVAGVFVLYHQLPHRAENVWLLAASFGFYALWDWRFGLVLLGLTLVNFWLAQVLARTDSRSWLWAGIGLNILVLLIFKYNHFYLPELSHLLGGVDLGALTLLVPVGLSFYLVQVISTLVDVRMKRIQPEKDWLLFCLYLFYFPKLLSGPIERARTFIPKLKQPRVVNADLFVRSLSLVLVGLFRKMVIADSLMALAPQDAFTNPAAYSAQHLVTWLLGYAFALYNDFAGYTSIVRGISGLLGIELSQNFIRPYSSRNFTEFWKRWHISLSEWLRDYIFFPTTRSLLKMISNRQHFINLVVPPMVTMLVSGLWHGLSWHMLVWGGLHGLYQVVERVISLRRPVRPDSELPRWRKSAAVGLVFILTVLAWVPFRMELPAALDYLSGMFNPANWANPGFRQAASDLIHGKGFWSWPEYHLPDPRVFLVILPALWLDWRQEKWQDELFFLQWRPWMQVVLLAAALLTLLVVSGADQQVPFVYQGF
jgi:D-alanyl-lipoteichoic acid acyltransferase DltB (MBOAT superfamily)